MLSKYFYQEKSSTHMELEYVLPALTAELGRKHTGVRIEQAFPHGTMGVFFTVYMDGRRKFVKTHQSSVENRKNLIKEINIMTLLYKGVIEIERVDIMENETQFVFMIMEYLFPAKTLLLPQNIRECIEFYQEKLAQGFAAGETEYTFGQVIGAGKESLEILYSKDFLDKELYLRCKDSLQRAADKKPSEMTAVCHGDLSNGNVMYSRRGIPVVIDWEDSFMAFPEYDFLYWLTFYDQRKHYSCRLLERYGIEKVWAADVMVLIILVKSYMSYRNGSCVNNKMTFQDRINEIYHIFR